MMAPVNTPPGLFLKDASCTLQAPPGLSLPDREVSRPVVAPPPGFAHLEIHTTTTKAHTARAVVPSSIGLPPGLSQVPEEKQVATEKVKRQVFSISDHLDVKDDAVLAGIDLSDYYDDSTDDDSDSEYDSDFARSVLSHASSLDTQVGGSSTFRVDAPVFMPSFQKGFRANALAFQPVSSLNARVKKDATSKTSSGSDSEASVTTMASSAAPAKKSLWSKKESKSHAGKFYYVNSKSGKTSWTVPEDLA